MKLRPLKIEKKPSIMIIPMIDIIFFLLVFFMMSMLSMTARHTLDLDLPRASSAELTAVKSLPVSITRDGTIYVEKEKISPEKFLRRIELEKERNPEMTVLLSADARSEHGDFLFVLDKLNAAGIQKISIAAEPEPSPAEQEIP
mgnify:FL=1